MDETSAFWLRVAALLYSVGLLHAILTVARRREVWFGPAVAAARLGAILHAVSVVDRTMRTGHFLASDIYESFSLLALLIVAAFLAAHWKYGVAQLGIVIFPMAFTLTLLAAMSGFVRAWPSSAVRDTWLSVHVLLVLLGYAALLLMTVGALIYLFQERELKRKQPRSFYQRLPALGTLDDLISRSMTVGFVLITLAVAVGSTWAFVEIGTSWIREPKIAVSLFTWGIYMLMLVLRISAGWRGRKAAVLALTAVGCSAVTWAAHKNLISILQP
ncbi:MAG: cytochrome c biogenesis protein CcsA [Bryobacterales bacterium]|nr:cytochrome c biogenesis protein CcsA [Bryobacterales bacterium]